MDEPVNMQNLGTAPTPENDFQILLDERNTQLSNSLKAYGEARSVSTVSSAALMVQAREVAVARQQLQQANELVQQKAQLAFARIYAERPDLQTDPNKFLAAVMEDPVARHLNGISGMVANIVQQNVHQIIQFNEAAQNNRRLLERSAMRQKYPMVDFDKYNKLDDNGRVVGYDWPSYYQKIGELSDAEEVKEWKAIAAKNGVEGMENLNTVAELQSAVGKQTRIAQEQRAARYQNDNIPTYMSRREENAYRALSRLKENLAKGDDVSATDIETAERDLQNARHDIDDYVTKKSGGKSSPSEVQPQPNASATVTQQAGGFQFSMPAQDGKKDTSGWENVRLSNGVQVSAPSAGKTGEILSWAMDNPQNPKAAEILKIVGKKPAAAAPDSKTAAAAPFAEESKISAADVLRYGGKKIIDPSSIPGDAKLFSQAASELATEKVLELVGKVNKKRETLGDYGNRNEWNTYLTAFDGMVSNSELSPDDQKLLRGVLKKLPESTHAKFVVSLLRLIAKQKNDQQP